MKRARNKSPLQKASDLPWTSIDFSSCLERARCIEVQILNQCRNHGFSEQDLFALQLSIEEALVNACKHGNQMDPAKHVKVQYRITPQRADIVIEDQGPGFKPAEVPDPTADENLEVSHGRGILLMRAYMSNVVFSPKGNKVTLTKFNESAADTGAQDTQQWAMG